MAVTELPCVLLLQVMLAKQVVSNLLYHSTNGGAFGMFAKYMAENFALEDDQQSFKYHADVLAWQNDMLANGHVTLPYEPYIFEHTRNDRNTPSGWTYQIFTAAFERAVDPVLHLLEQDGAVRDSCSRNNGSMPMMGVNCKKWREAPPDPNDPDYWLTLGLDHNCRTAKKCKAKFVWNVTNAVTKELMYQRFTTTTATSDWIPHLAALAATPFCRGRIKTVFVDNLTRAEGKDVETLQSRIKEACGLQCEHVVQDIWHVSNTVQCRANNR